jgi:hypothetical protein
MSIHLSGTIRCAKITTMRGGHSMSVLLADVLRDLALQPGESCCVPVDDYEVEIRRPMLQVQDAGPMVDIFLNVPPSPKSITLVVEKRTPILPSRIEITDSDLAPE